MVRRSNSQAAKEARKLAGYFKKLGIDVDGQQEVGNALRSGSKFGNSDQAIMESYHERMERVRNEVKMAQERVELEAESVLFFIASRGKGFTDKKCAECELPFASTYAAVAYCSNLCRFKNLAKNGIQWNPYGKTDSERWDGRIPKVVGPQALQAAWEVVDRLVEEDAEAENSEDDSVDEVIDPSEEDFDIMLQEIVSGQLDEEEEE
jgi:hypothetical protein